MTVGPISKFWDIAEWKLPRRLITVLLLSWIILFLLLFFIAGELKETRTILHKIVGGKPLWFYVMAVSWFVLMLYFLCAAVIKIVQRILQSFRC